MAGHPDRRSFLRVSGAAAASLALRGRAGAEPTPRRPNLVVILSDDMGFSDLGCYGGEIRTPHLDQLAAGGLRFSQFYNTARCCPTRASLLTGLYPHQAGVGHMTARSGQLEGYEGQLNEHCVTLAEALRPAGYRTYMVGKWHVCHDVLPDGDRSAWPLQRGFERYYGTLAGAGSYYDPGALVRDNTHVTPTTDPDYRTRDYYYTDALGENASRFLDDHARTRAGEPFFLYAAFTAAHWPLHAPAAAVARTRGRYDGGYDPVRRARWERLRASGLIHREWGLNPTVGDWTSVTNKAWEARCMEVYAAQVECLDAAIGQMVRALRRNGQLDNTLLLFLQDNGGCQEAIGRSGTTPRAAQPTLPRIAPDAIRTDVHPQQTRDGYPMLGGTAVLPGPADTFISYGLNWANVSNTPFREYKHFVHEGGISTPLIAHWPARIDRPGQIETTPGHVIDIMATCLDASGTTAPTTRAGQPVPPPEGRSLLPAFAGKPVPREALFWEHEGNRALRVGAWKLVAKAPGGPWELYDLEADRTELHNLADREPQRTQAMAATWEAWAKRTNALPWPWKPAYGATAGPPPATGPQTLTLHAGDSLAGERAPWLVGRTIIVTARIDASGQNGVVVAQGGTKHGFALCVQRGRLVAALRREGVLTAVTAPQPFPAGEHDVGLELRRDGTLALLQDGVVVAQRTAGGLLTGQPVDGLDVGCDRAGGVGDYRGEQRFGGRLLSLTLQLG